MSFEIGERVRRTSSGEFGYIVPDPAPEHGPINSRLYSVVDFGDARSGGTGLPPGQRRIYDYGLRSLCPRKAR